MVRAGSGLTRGGALVAAIALAAVASGSSHAGDGLGGAVLAAAPAQTTPVTAWPYHVEWTYPRDGAIFRLCVDDQCGLVHAFPVGVSQWRTPLPRLPEGEHRIVIEACDNLRCIAGTPDMVVRVTPASSRRPPIDVVTGPRIPATRR